MRKTSLLVMVCLAATLLGGCGDGKESAVSTVEESSVVESTSEKSVVESDISYATRIPSVEDAFPDGEVTKISDGETMYCVSVTGYKDGEYEKYVEECKTAGFTDVRFDITTDSNRKFEARSEDGKFYVSLQLLVDERKLNITCGKRRNTE